VSAVQDRFWSKVVEAPSGCWEWTACVRGNGYGKFTVDGRSTAAHRFAFEEMVGPIPEGLVLDHLCRVRTCVNPDHLEPVTQQVNVLRGEAGARQRAQTSCIRGHAFDAANTYICGAGKRSCRICRYAAVRAYRARKAVSA
jgi:hypothetical protein